jgi:hypothetical protein
LTFLAQEIERKSEVRMKGSNGGIPFSLKAFKPPLGRSRSDGDRYRGEGEVR